MTLFWTALLKISAVLLLALAGEFILAKRRSAAVRHWILSVAIGLAAAIPAATYVMPAWELPPGAANHFEKPAALTTAVSFQIAETTPLPAMSPSSTDPHAVADRPARVERAAAAIWMAGIAVSFGLLLVGFARLASIAARSQRLVEPRWTRMANELCRTFGVRRAVGLLVSDRRSLLVTWGVLRPRVLVPAAAVGWSDERIRIVLAHELAHVARNDWATQILAELLRGVYWFNPLVWVVCRRLRRQSEQACDDAVLGLGIQGTDYASQLVELARTFERQGRTALPAPAIVESGLERRVRAMLNDELNRSPIHLRGRLVTVVVAAALTLPIAALRAQSFATLNGTIADQTGGIIPNATVTVTHVASQTKHEVRADPSGNFQFVGLLSGEYQFQSLVPGFRKQQDTLTLVAGQTTRHDVMLQVGSLEETLRVWDGETAAVPPPPPPPPPPQSPPTTGAAGPVAPPPPPPQSPEERLAQLRARMEACAPSSIGGRIMPPTKIKDAKPEFPETRRGTKVAALVTLAARIGVDGSVEDVQPTSSGNPDLEAAAMTAVRQWQFTPTYLNCAPIPVSMTVTVRFEPQP